MPTFWGSKCAREFVRLPWSNSESRTGREKGGGDEGWKNISRAESGGGGFGWVGGGGRPAGAAQIKLRKGGGEREATLSSSSPTSFSPLFPEKKYKKREENIWTWQQASASCPPKEISILGFFRGEKKNNIVCDNAISFSRKT